MIIMSGEDPGMRQECHSSTLSIVESLPVEKGILGKQLVDFRPLSQITHGSVIDFEVPNNSPFHYISLGESRIRVVGQIVEDDGAETPLPEDPPPPKRVRRETEDEEEEEEEEEEEASASGSTTQTSFIGVSNLPLHAIFSQAELSLQGHPTVSNSHYYPYKAYIDALENMKFRDMSRTGELFYMDSSGSFDKFDDSNVGFKVRRKHFVRSKKVELIGNLACDFAQQPNLLINNVPIRLKLTPSRSEFVLLGEQSSKRYKFKIVEASFQVMRAHIDPSVILGQAEALKHKPAEYTFNESLMSIQVMPAGLYSKVFENLFPSEAPSEIVVALVSSAAFNGEISKNPFNFAHMNCSFMDLTLDGQSVNPGPFMPDYEKRMYMESFLSFYDRGQLKRESYLGGYALYKFKLGELNTRDSVAPPCSGHIRLTIRLEQPLDEPVTVIIYGKRPTILRIDENRNILR